MIVENLRDLHSGVSSLDVAVQAPETIMNIPDSATFVLFYTTATGLRGRINNAAPEAKGAAVAVTPILVTALKKGFDIPSSQWYARQLEGTVGRTLHLSGVGTVYVEFI